MNLLRRILAWLTAQEGGARADCPYGQHWFSASLSPETRCLACGITRFAAWCIEGQCQRCEHPLLQCRCNIIWELSVHV